MESLNLKQATAVIINTCLGSGFLVIPYVFLNIGTLASIAILAILTFFSIVTGLMIIETLSRAEAAKSMMEDGVALPKVSFADLLRAPKKEGLLDKGAYKPHISSERKFELLEICEVFLGDVGKKIFSFIMTVEIDGLLCSYIMIAVTSFLDNVPLGPFSTCNIYETTSLLTECRIKYWVWLCIVASLFLLITLKEIREQKFIQMASTYLRAIILGMMIVTSGVSVILDLPLNSSLPKEQGTFSLTHLATGIAVLQCTTIFHNVLPSLIQNLSNKEENSKKAVIIGCSGVAVFCGVMGVVCSKAFEGYSVLSLSTLAWSGYDASIFPRPFWTRIVEFMVILFPALNMFTSAPINAIVLSENVVSYLPTHLKTRFSRKQLLVTTKMCVWAVPLVLNVFFYDMGKVTAFLGLCSFIVMFINGALNFLVSRRKVTQKSQFEGWHSSDILAWFIIVISSVILSTNFYFIYIH